MLCSHMDTDTHTQFVGSMKDLGKRDQGHPGWHAFLSFVGGKPY